MATDILAQMTAQSGSAPNSGYQLTFPSTLTRPRPSQFTCSAEERDDVMKTLINFVDSGPMKHLSPPLVICIPDTSDDISWVLGNLKSRQSLAVEFTCAHIACAERRGSPRELWLAFVIQDFRIGNMKYLVPPHLDMHVTLGYIRKPDDAALEAMKKRIQLQCSLHWRPPDGPAPVCMNVYGTEEPYIWRFTRFSKAYQSFQNVLNILHAWDKTSRNSILSAPHTRVLHLSVYDRPCCMPAWIR